MNRPRRLNAPVIEDGYMYHHSRTRNGVTHIDCKRLRRGGCFARGTLAADGSVQLQIPHNHAPDNLAEQTAIFRRELKAMVVTRTGTLREIFNHISILYPEAALRITYPSIESTMRTWRRKNVPPLPQTLQEYAALLEVAEWARYANCVQGRFFQSLVEGTDGSISVVFGNRDFINRISDATVMHADATFKVVPRVPSAYQLMVFFVCKYDHMLPFAYALMTRKTAAAYNAVISFIKDDLAPQLRPSTIMTDFEAALYQSLMAAFQGSEVHGCFFHYCQAIYRRARKWRVVDATNGNVEGTKLLRKVMALALLPPIRIMEGYQILQHEARAQGDTFTLLLAYTFNTWLRRVTPEVFSVFGLVRRTNNNVEAFHKRFQHTLGVEHPNVWQFTEQLINTQNAVQIDLGRLERGLQPTRSMRFNYVENGARVWRCWRSLADGRITTAEFLNQASHLVETLERNLREEALGQAAVFEPEDLIQRAHLPEAPQQADIIIRDPLLPVNPPPEQPDVLVVPAGRGRRRPAANRRRGRPRRGQNEVPAAPHPPQAHVLPPPPPPPTPPIQAQPINPCVACLINERQVLMMDCRHIVLCEDCAAHFRVPLAEWDDVPATRCPQCRTTIRTPPLRIFLP